MKQIMIKNGTPYSNGMIFEYLAGFTTRLNDKIEVITESGQYYATVIVKPKNK